MESTSEKSTLWKFWLVWLICQVIVAALVHHIYTEWDLAPAQKTALLFGTGAQAILVPYGLRLRWLLEFIATHDPQDTLTGFLYLAANMAAVAWAVQAVSLPANWQMAAVVLAGMATLELCRLAQRVQQAMARPKLAPTADKPVAGVGIEPPSAA